MLFCNRSGPSATQSFEVVRINGQGLSHRIYQRLNSASGN